MSLCAASCLWSSTHTSVVILRKDCGLEKALRKFTHPVAAQTDHPNINILHGNCPLGQVPKTRLAHNQSEIRRLQQENIYWIASEQPKAGSHSKKNQFVPSTPNTYKNLLWFVFLSQVLCGGWKQVSGLICDTRTAARVKERFKDGSETCCHGLETVTLKHRQEAKLEVFWCSFGVSGTDMTAWKLFSCLSCGL